ncbi:YjiH family protein [Synergistes jonesii]|uniref:YjiH family protein n=1 Tax=Synergistes jonesii TaxID=2754 RepID=UPI00248DA3CB|nr:YjiH family protein [Synergistes jonesii]
MEKGRNNAAVLKFLLYSLFGIFMFFFPLNIGGKSTIPVDHIITFITKDLAVAAKYYILLVMYVGAVLPFIRKNWNKDGISVFFSVAKVCGAVVGTILVFDLNPPAWLSRPDFGPFLYDKLSTPVGLVIPIGSVFLAFLASFGLMEFTGVLMTPIMRPVFRTPGRSAIDAVASFVGSYSIALLITNGVYRQGKYSAREAATIATGFSTVSATFLLIVAKTLDLMDRWGLYFWVTLAVTFVVSAITARLWPLSSIPDTYYTGEKTAEPEYTGNLLARAWQAGVDTAAKTEALPKLVWNNLYVGLNMAFNVIPSIMSVGLLGLVLAEFTPLFDWFGYVFYPFFKIFGVQQAALAGKAAAVSLPEMFLPAILIAKSATPLVKFVIAVVSISEILFFSASIPCVMGTDIPIKLKDILVIWFERVVLSIVITVPLAMLLGFKDVL